MGEKIGAVAGYITGIGTIVIILGCMIAGLGLSVSIILFALKELHR